MTVTKVLSDQRILENESQTKGISLAASQIFYAPNIPDDWEDLNQIAVCAKWNSIISGLYEDEPGEPASEASNPTSYGRAEEAS